MRLFKEVHAEHLAAQRDVQRVVFPVKPTLPQVPQNPGGFCVRRLIRVMSVKQSEVRQRFNATVAEIEISVENASQRCGGGADMFRASQRVNDVRAVFRLGAIFTGF